MLKMKTNDLIALMHILDNFKKFDDDLNKLIVDYSFTDFASVLNEVICKEEKIDYRYVLVNKFYKKYYDTINTINIYTNIEDFINTNYIGIDTSIRSDIRLFYKILTLYKDISAFIIKLLERIQNLGIDYILLNPNLESEQESSIDIKYGTFQEIDYFANVTLYSKEKEKIYYKSLNTPYVIHFKENLTEIEVQNLLFSSSLLPDDISKEEVFNNVLFEGNNIDIFTLLNQYEKLHTCVSDMYSLFGRRMEEINSLDKIEDIKEIRNNLNVIKNDLDRLSEVAQESTNDILGKHKDMINPLTRIK